jgi:hypothetical protein
MPTSTTGVQLACRDKVYKEQQKWCHLMSHGISAVLPAQCVLCQEAFKRPGDGYIQNFTKLLGLLPELRSALVLQACGSVGCTEGPAGHTCMVRTAARTVSAAMGVFGKSCLRLASSRYAGLKSWPQSLTQCACSSRGWPRETHSCCNKQSMGLFERKKHTGLYVTSRRLLLPTCSFLAALLLNVAAMSAHSVLMQMGWESSRKACYTQHAGILASSMAKLSNVPAGQLRQPCWCRPWVILPGLHYAGPGSV